RFQGSLAFRPGALGEEKARRPREAVCGDVAPDPDRRGCRAPLRSLGIQFVRKGGAGVARGAGQDRHRQPDSAPDPAAEVRESRDRQRARDARGRDQGRPGDHFAAGGADVAQELRADHRSEEHTSELQSPYDLVCRLLLEKKKTPSTTNTIVKITISAVKEKLTTLAPEFNNQLHIDPECHPTMYDQETTKHTINSSL